jgi:hypothetical protein
MKLTPVTEKKLNFDFHRVLSGSLPIKAIPTLTKPKATRVKPYRSPNVNSWIVKQGVDYMHKVKSLGFRVAF